jgi:hypothetical protein
MGKNQRAIYSADTWHVDDGTGTDGGERRKTPVRRSEAVASPCADAILRLPSPAVGWSFGERGPQLPARWAQAASSSASVPRPTSAVTGNVQGSTRLRTWPSFPLMPAVPVPRTTFAGAIELPTAPPAC